MILDSARDVDGSFGSPDAHAVGDQHLSESPGCEKRWIRHCKAAPKYRALAAEFPRRREFAPWVLHGPTRGWDGDGPLPSREVTHIKRNPKGDRFNPGREAQTSRRKDLERDDVFVEGECRHGRGEPLVQVSRIPLRS